MYDNNTTATGGSVGANVGYRLDPNGSANGPNSSSYVAAGTEVTIPLVGTVHLPGGGGIGVNSATRGTFQVDFVAVRVGSATP
jgi:hypothetical protein